MSIVTDEFKKVQLLTIVSIRVVLVRTLFEIVELVKTLLYTVLFRCLRP